MAQKIVETSQRNKHEARESATATGSDVTDAGSYKLCIEDSLEVQVHIGFITAQKGLLV